MSDDLPVSGGGGRYPGRGYPPPPPEPGRVDAWDDEIRLGDYWRLLVRRRWSILAVASTVVLGTMVWTFSQTPVYQAVSRLQIDPEDPNILSFQDAYSAEISTDDGLRTQFEILNSRTLARSIVEELDLEDSGELVRTSAFGSFIAGLGELVPGREAPASPSDPLNQVVDRYLDRLSVSPVRQARLVDISFESEDPEFAVRVINAHAAQFIEQNLRYRFEANQLAAEFLEGNLTSLKINLEDAEDALQAYSREHQIIFGENGESTAAEVLAELQTRYTQALAERFSQEAYTRLIRDGDAAAIARVTENELISGLNSQLTSLRAEESDLAVGLGERMPALQRLRARIGETEQQLDSEIARVLRTVEAEYQVAIRNEALLGEAVEAQRDLVNQVNQEIIQYNILAREADAAQRMYESLLNRLGEASVSTTLEASNVRIVDPATLPDRPVRPRKALNLVLSLVVGLGLGVGAALVQEHMDDAITSGEDVAAFLGVPTLGMIPKAGSRPAARPYAYAGGYARIGSPGESLAASDETAPARVEFHAKENPLEFLSYCEPMSVVAEAFRSVRTSLMLSFPDQPPRSILVTSPSPGEGKTVTALNVAISLTQTGARTLLVNTDMRKPRLDSLFALDEGRGLSALLTGAATLEESVAPMRIPNLYLLPCGALPPNPAELLMSNRFRQVVAELREKFDYVVFDSPPVGSVSDARILAHFVDCTVVVVRAASTSRHLARHVLDQLGHSGSKTAGVILNDVDFRNLDHYYHYAGSGYAAYRS
jgi:capsular exopolysaccharide synthesis family protein